MLGKRLKILRNEYSMTQQDLADKIGINRATIAGYETKGIEPSHETLTKMADIFDCSIDYLLGKTTEKTSADKIKAALSDDPELLSFWDELKKREDLQLMFKQTRDLDPAAIKQIIEIIKTFEKEEEERYNGG
ncbi:MAG: helix-turn-helix domain-containing protein [Firmicutes bacterium]|nr:helix-turn-helix domain-containing protein [Bacillota bacterium]